ncbi:MAG: CDP-alcohol phosphatidyltransferase family protein [Eubacteriales bacterium]
MKAKTILMSKSNLNLPNILSIIRILLVGVLILFFKKGMTLAAFITYLTASATDLIDGYIARKYDLITPLGKLLDPFADKLMLVTVLCCMYLSGILPLWVLIVIVTKEALQILGGFLMFHKRDTVVQSNIFGKLTTVFFSFSVVLLFLHDYVSPYDIYVIIFTVLFAIFALVQYVVKYLRSSSGQEKEHADEIAS